MSQPEKKHKKNLHWRFEKKTQMYTPCEKKDNQLNKQNKVSFIFAAPPLGLHDWIALWKVFWFFLHNSQICDYMDNFVLLHYK